MSKLDDLITELCPDGVEYKKLVDVANILYGHPFDAKGFTNDSTKIPVIRIRNIVPAKAGTYYNGEILSAYLIKKGDILVGMDGSFNLAKWNDRDALLNQRVCKISSKDETIVLNGYLYHSLQQIFKDVEESITGSTVKHLTAKRIKSIIFPLPPLSAQSEIVRILDTFTELTEELTEELTARRKQYEYYRDKILTFTEGVEYKRLGDILTIRNGRSYSDRAAGTIPVYGSGGIMAYVDSYTYNQPSVLIPRKGSINKLYYVDEPFWNIDTIFYTEINQTLAYPKFVYYSLQKLHLEKLNKAGGVPSLTQEILNKIKIPIPPLPIQSEIVQILDRFDKLCNDLTQGLPAEINARRKQYEYYRDTLLTFKQKKTAK